MLASASKNYIKTKTKTKRKTKTKIKRKTNLTNSGETELQSRITTGSAVFDSICKPEPIIDNFLLS